jgi:hypothetical protein
VRGRGGAVALVVAVGALVAHAVAVLATLAWFGGGPGPLTTGALVGAAATSAAAAAGAGAVVAGLVARRAIGPATVPLARVSTAAGPAAYAVVTALATILGGALVVGLASLVVGPAVAVGVAFLPVREPASRRA